MPESPPSRLADLNPMSSEFIAEVARVREEAESWLAKNIRMALVIPRDKMKSLWPGGMRLEDDQKKDEKTGESVAKSNVKPVIEKILPGVVVLGCEISGSYLFVLLDEKGA